MPSISIDSRDDIRSTYEESSKPLERIASLDFQRGLAIFLMIFVHGAANIIDYSYIEEDPTIVKDLPIPIILIFVVLAFFAVWNSYFLLISVTVNSYSMVRGIENGKEPERIVLKQCLTGFGLLLVNMIHQSFMATGYFGIAIITGDWSNTYPLWNGFFNMGTLRIIGLSLIISSIVLYFILKNNGHKKFYRNILILGILALVFIIPSQFIHNWIDGLNWIVPGNLPIGSEFTFNNVWPNVEFQALNASFKSWTCSLIAGDVMPIFPYFGSAFIGAIIGLSLANPKEAKRLPLKGGLSGVFIIGLGVLLIFLTSFTFGTTRPPIGNYLFMLGGQLCTLFLFLWLVEYRGKSQKF
jgi:predicted acyltransferase